MHSLHAQPMHPKTSKKRAAKQVSSRDPARLGEIRGKTRFEFAEFRQVSRKALTRQTVARMVGPTSFSARGILSTAVLAGQACAAAGNVILLQASDGDGSAASGNRTAAPGVAVVAKEEEDGNMLTVPIALGLFLVLCFFCGAIMFCAYKRTKVRREAPPWWRSDAFAPLPCFSVADIITMRFLALLLPHGVLIDDVCGCIGRCCPTLRLSLLLAPGRL